MVWWLSGSRGAVSRKELLVVSGLGTGAGVRGSPAGIATGCGGGSGDDAAAFGGVVG